MHPGRRSRRWSSCIEGSGDSEARWAWKRSAGGCESSTAEDGRRVVQCQSCRRVVLTGRHRPLPCRRDLLLELSDLHQLLCCRLARQTVGATRNCSLCFSGDFPHLLAQYGARVCSPGLVNPPGLAPPLWNLYSRLAAAEAELGEVRTLLRDAVEGLQVFSRKICLIPFHTLPIFSQV